jgi:hypothetical protein
MFSKFLCAAVLAIPLTAALPAPEAKADTTSLVGVQTTQAVRTSQGHDYRRDYRRDHWRRDHWRNYDRHYHWRYHYRWYPYCW